MQSFLSEGALVDFGNIQADLLLEDDRIVGEIQNNSNYDLKDVSLIMGNKFVRLGDLSRGQSVPVDMSMVGTANPNFRLSAQLCLV